ncbi:hypothetical protein GBAR_LOCUS542 [Geodia barretti]|uniref:Uncharacterized protein n=1 Tax=Geodia barretti TaxID=519541 RepID=A0AA35QSW3_GEOBA|nr:hypothetical protein GBAR_LOCUS542 [Geodia barretti]
MEMGTRRNRTERRKGSNLSKNRQQNHQKIEIKVYRQKEIEEAVGTSLAPKPTVLDTTQLVEALVCKAKKQQKGGKTRLTAGSSTAKGPSRHPPAVKKPSNGAQTQTNNTPGHNAARRGSGVQRERAAAESQRLTANGSAAKRPSQHTSAAKTPSNGAQTSNGSQRTETATNRQQQTGNLTQKLTVRRPAPVANSDGGQISKVKSLATTE